MFTQCEVSISPNCCVIQNNKPVFSDVHSLLIDSVDQTKSLLRGELELEKGDLDSNIKVVGGDELAVLSKNFNKLVSDIKNLLKQKERLLADVSHELRTPLAKIRLAVAMLPKHNKIQSIDKQISAIDSMITNILLSDKIASAYSNLKIEPIEVGDLINRSLDLSFIKDVVVDIEDFIVLRVDVVKTSIAIKNLLENAFKYSDNRKVRLLAYKKNSHYIISVLSLIHI